MNVVPAPAEIVVRGPSFELGPRTTIHVGELERLGKTLRDYLAPATGLALPFAGPGADQIRLRIDRQLHENPEGFRLEVLADGVEIVGAGEAGVFYGIQTLRQLLPEEIYAATPVAGIAWRVPGVVVVDAPRFAWRGALVDLCPAPSLFRLLRYFDNDRRSNRRRATRADHRRLEGAGGAEPASRGRCYRRASSHRH